MSKTTPIENFVRDIIKLVWNFDVDLNVEFDALGIKVQVLSKNDEVLKQIVGKGGQNINALRHLAYLWGIRNKAKINIFIMPPTNVIEKS